MDQWDAVLMCIKSPLLLPKSFADLIQWKAIGEKVHAAGCFQLNDLTRLLGIKLFIWIRSRSSDNGKINVNTVWQQEKRFLEAYLLFISVLKSAAHFTLQGGSQPQCLVSELTFSRGLKSLRSDCSFGHNILSCHLLYHQDFIFIHCRTQSHSYATFFL